MAVEKVYVRKAPPWMGLRKKARTMVVSPREPNSNANIYNSIG